MVDWLTDGVVLGESFDVSEGLFVCGFPFEGDILLGETGENGGPI